VKNGGRKGKGEMNCERPNGEGEKDSMRFCEEERGGDARTE